MSTSSAIAVVPEPADVPPLRDAAARLADWLRLTAEADDAPMHLTLTPQRLELRVVTGDTQLVGGHPLVVDLLKLDTTSGPGRSLGTPMLKAVGIRKGRPHRPTVIDATAGLGEDAWLLASHGCTVAAIERSPVVFALLTDGLRRAGEARPEVAARLGLMRGEAIEMMPTLDRPDVVLLDPMFPPGRKTVEKKPMRVLRRVVGDDADAARLLAGAMKVAARRVVVKRPRRAPPIQGPKPTTSHKGKALRFDVYAVGENGGQT